MDIRVFRKNIDNNGPMVPGIKAVLALEKLKKFKEELERPDSPSRFSLNLDGSCDRSNAC
jgi:hypothetical protein